MLTLLQSPWVASLLGCLLYLATTAALLRPGQFEGAHPAAEIKPSSVAAGPSWQFRNPEFEQWLEELKQEREALAVRERQLREFQTRLAAEREELLTVTQAVRVLQTEFEKNVVRLKEQEVENLKKQTKLIAGMSPEGGAAMLSEMPDDEIVRILFTLKSDAASQILDTISRMGKAEAKRAASLSERLRVVLPTPATKSQSGQSK